MESDPDAPDPDTEVVPMIARELGVKVIASHRKAVPADDVTSSDDEDSAQPEPEPAAVSGSDTETSDEDESGDGNEQVVLLINLSWSLDLL